MRGARIGAAHGTIVRNSKPSQPSRVASFWAEHGSARRRLTPITPASASTTGGDVAKTDNGDDGNRGDGPKHKAVRDKGDGASSSTPPAWWPKDWKEIAITVSGLWYLMSLKSDIKLLKEDLKHDIKLLKEDLKHDIALLRKDLDGFRKDLDGFRNTFATKSDFATFKADITVALGDFRVLLAEKTR